MAALFPCPLARGVEVGVELAVSDTSKGGLVGGAADTLAYDETAHVAGV